MNLVLHNILTDLPFSSLQRFKLTDLPLMSTTIKLQTDVTSPIYPSFLNFFASMPPISPSTFFASTVEKKVQFLMTSYLITIHDGHYYSWWLINIHDYANHAYSYIFKRLCKFDLTLDPQSDPWPLWIFIDFIDRLRHTHCLKNQ